MRRLLRKKHFERIDYYGDLLLPLGEYPVNSVLAVYVENPHPCGFSTRSFRNAKTPAKAVKTAASMPPKAMGSGELLEPDLYSVIPEGGADPGDSIAIFHNPYHCVANNAQSRESLLIFRLTKSPYIFLHITLSRRLYERAKKP
jgi:hypothetical protein